MGDIVVGSEIIGVHKHAIPHIDVERGDGFEISRTLTRRIVGKDFDQIVLEKLSSNAHRTKMVCTADAVFSTDAKRTLGKNSNAQTVDMESYALIASCVSPIRVMFLRVVSDAVTDELPPEVGEFLTEKRRRAYRKNRSVCAEKSVQYTEAYGT